MTMSGWTAQASWKTNKNASGFSAVVRIKVGELVVAEAMSSEQASEQNAVTKAYNRAAAKALAFGVLAIRVPVEVR